MQQDIKPTLIRIADALEKMLGLLSAQMMPDETRVKVNVAESNGSCPACGSLDVLMEGTYPKVLFHCKECKEVWVNEVSDFFGG